jgi:hypothetical protein
VQDITLITSPSYHHKPANYRLLILAAPNLQNLITEILREVWPDSGLSVYFVDKLEGSTAEWLSYHMAFAHRVILYVNATTPAEFLPLAMSPDVTCVVEDGAVSEAMLMMLYHHAEATSAASLREMLCLTSDAVRAA